jgi:hypothetical protein
MPHRAHATPTIARFSVDLQHRMRMPLATSTPCCAALTSRMFSMKYSQALQILDYVNTNDGMLSLDADDPSFDWLEACECVRRNEQRRSRRGEAPLEGGVVLLAVSSDLAPRSSLAAWEVSPLSTLVCPMIERLMAEEEGTK